MNNLKHENVDLIPSKANSPGRGGRLNGEKEGEEEGEEEEEEQVSVEVTLMHESQTFMH